MEIYAKSHGVLPGNTDISALEKMLDSLKNNEDEKTLIFEPGEYIIDAEKLQSHMLYITNTVGDKEFSKDETPHKNRAMLYLNGVKNLVIKGNGARFIADGKATNAALEDCESVEIKDIEFAAKSPDMHEISVVGKSGFYVDYKIDDDSRFTYENGKLFFEGNGYKVAADKGARFAYHIGLIKKDTPQKVERVRHPLATALKIKPLDGRIFRVYYLNTRRFDLGDCFYIYDSRRQYAGIFLNRCKKISLTGVRQRFNYSLAFVAQDCDTLRLDGVDFSPEENSTIKMASAADFVQICMCRGRVEVKNSRFCGAGDDCINTHGIHFKISSDDCGGIIARFMHPQTHGFNPLRVGDTIAFINPADLLEYGRAKITNSRLLNEYEIKLELDNTEIPPDCSIIEDITACPELVFENNTVSRIITRAVLYTSRGKCTIKNNHFISNTMSGILLSDDARNWYESGMCLDVNVEGNTFDYCGATPILIKPENKIHNGAVHKNIEIKNNVFKKYQGVCIKAKSTDGIKISGNTFLNDAPLSAKNCENVIIDR